MDLFEIVFTELESANLFLCLSQLFLKCEKNYDNDDDKSFIEKNTSQSED